MKASIVIGMDSPSFETEGYEAAFELSATLRRMADDVDEYGICEPGHCCHAKDSKGRVIGRLIVQEGSHSENLKIST